VIAVRIDESGPVAWSAAQCLGLAGAGVAFDGVEGQVQAAGALQEADALVQQAVDLPPTLAGGLFADTGGPSRVDRGPAGAVGANLGEGLVAEVRPEMPSVADLHRVRQGASNRLPVGARPVAADDLNPGVGAQPGFQGFGTAAGQHIDPLARPGVDEDGGITVTALEREIIDTQHTRGPQ
jgi:hypothetical protein